MSSEPNPAGSPPDAGKETRPMPTMQAVLRDIAGLGAGVAIWSGVLSIPWMQAILDTGPFLLWPLIPLVVLLSGLISMIAVRNRFLVADLSWVAGLIIGGGLGSEVFTIGLAEGVRVLLYTGAWYALLYAPLVMIGIWVVDRFRGQDA
ncbi:MAG: hypothetical protein Q8P31_12390 [Bacillota bacterium]|nr:hypothetical protein [Bacillota bacterium]